jgi:hypothetical protein
MKGSRSLRISKLLLPTLAGLMLAQVGCSTDGSAQPETQFHTPRSRPVPVAQVETEAIAEEEVIAPPAREHTLKASLREIQG